EWKWSDLLSLAKKLEEEDSSDYLFTDPGDFPYRLINIVRANFPDMVDYEKKTVNFHQDWFVDLMKQLKEVNKSFNIAYDISRNPVKNPAWTKDFMGDGMLYQE
ncbi:hypothetical protein, partial [Bacillus licheniformis]|uniref:hypothetical protein n=1 Tax=Bacillus licheniformis TaxID=1402 RepID=UPI00163B35E7